MSANDKHPNGLANGSDQVGRNYMFHNSQAVLAISLEPNPTLFQKTLALNDFYFGMDGFDYPMGNIQMIGKSLGADVPGREAAGDRAAPDRPARRSRLPRGGFLAHHRGPARSEQSRHRGQVGQADAELHAEQPGAQAEAVRQAQIDAQPSGHASGSSDPAQHLYEDRNPARRLRPPGRDLPVRHRPEDLGAGRRTARRTSSTICMSWTPASSSASGR